MKYKFLLLGKTFFLGLLLVSCNNTYKINLLDQNQILQTNSIAQLKIPDGININNYDLKFKDSNVNYQVSNNTLYWIVSPKNYNGPFILEPSNSSTIDSNKIKSIEGSGQFSVFVNNQEVLGYQMDIKKAPKGISSSYERSGYIHPLKTLKGKRLTRIQPEDHYHHYGIWNPWTHTLIEGDTIDFWNLYKEEGTVKFSKILSKELGDVFSEFKVLHEHIVLKNNKNKTVLNETQTVRITPISDKQYYIDFEINYSPLVSEFKILKYRYGGFGWRTTEEWNKDNSYVLSSEGKSRNNSDGSLAKWLIVEGELGKGYGGAVMMSYPKNYNHPEPLRVWPDTISEFSDLFVNISPTKYSDWIMKSKKNYSLRYRMLVYDGQISADLANNHWELYSKPLIYKINK